MFRSLPGIIIRDTCESVNYTNYVIYTLTSVPDDNPKKGSKHVGLVLQELYIISKIIIIIIIIIMHLLVVCFMSFASFSLSVFVYFIYLFIPPFFPRINVALSAV